MPVGSVRLYNVDRGYGFIKPDDDDADVFFHISALEISGLQAPREGTRLSFDVEQDKRTGKMRAVNLRPA
jgi:cold shock protein